MRVEREETCHGLPTTDDSRKGSPLWRQEKRTRDFASSIYKTADYMVGLVGPAWSISKYGCPLSALRRRTGWSLFRFCRPRFIWANDPFGCWPSLERAVEPLMFVRASGARIDALLVHMTKYNTLEARLYLASVHLCGMSTCRERDMLASELTFRLAVPCRRAKLGVHLWAKIVSGWVDIIYPYSNYLSLFSLANKFRCVFEPLIWLN